MGLQSDLSTYSFAAKMAALAACYIAAESLGPLVDSSLGFSVWMGYNLFSATWEASLAVGAVAVVLHLSGRATTKTFYKQFEKLCYESKTTKEREIGVKRNEKREFCSAASNRAKGPRKCLAADSPKQEGTAKLLETLANFIKLGDVHRASKTLLQLEQACGVVSLSHYTHVICMCSKARDAAAARWWLQKAQDRGLAPNEICFNAVLNACAKQGDLDQAFAVIEDMRQAGVQYDTVTYNTIIDACARADDAVRAQLWMKRMLSADVQPSVVSFASVMRACAKAGLTGELEHWLQQADKFGIELNTICFSAIINSFMKMEKLDTATAWLSRMIERGLTPSAPCFAGVLYGLINAEDMDSTGLLIEKLKAARVQLDAAVFSCAVSAAANSGHHKQAEEWAADIVASGYQLTWSAKSALMASNLIVPNPGAPKLAPASVKYQPEGQSISKSAARRALTGRRFHGIIKEFVSSKFGYIECDEVFAVYGRDVFLCSQQNPLQLGQGQRVCFTLQLDRQRGLPRASEVSVYQAENERAC